MVNFNTDTFILLNTREVHSLFLPYFACFLGVEMKATKSDKSTISTTEVTFRGKGTSVNRSLEPLPNKYKGKSFSVSMAPENDPNKLTDVSEK